MYHVHVDSRLWSVDNWDVGQPLHGFVSTNGFVADANNDVDFDNNGSGGAFTDIMSGIVTLTLDGEPLNDGDPIDCLFDYDAGGNNSIDFGFYDPEAPTGLEDIHVDPDCMQLFPNPVLDEFTITGNLGLYDITIMDSIGQIHQTINATGSSHTIDISTLPAGLYFVRVVNKTNNLLEIKTIIKQ